MSKPSEMMKNYSIAKLECSIKYCISISITNTNPNKVAIATPSEVQNMDITEMNGGNSSNQGLKPGITEL